MSMISDVFKKGLSDMPYWLSVDIADCSVTAIVMRDDPDWTIQILRNQRAYLVMPTADVSDRLRLLIRTGRFDLKRCVESPDGVDYLLESLKMDKSLNSIKRIPDEDEVWSFHGLKRTPTGGLPE